MDGCERCMPSWQEGKTWADCDLLDTYSYLRYQMPGEGSLQTRIFMFVLSAWQSDSFWIFKGFVWLHEHVLQKLPVQYGL